MDINNTHVGFGIKNNVHLVSSVPKKNLPHTITMQTDIKQDGSMFFYIDYTTFCLSHPTVAAQIENHQTRQTFLLLFNVGHL